MVDMVTRGVMGTAINKDAAHSKDSAVVEEEWGGFAEKRSKWSEQRAVVTRKPEGPVVAEVG
jgi:hypothetical protein